GHGATCSYLRIPSPVLTFYKVRNAVSPRFSPGWAARIVFRKNLVTRSARPRSYGMNNSRSLLVLVFSFVAAACAGTAAPDAPEQSSQAVQAAQPTADIQGTWV